MTEKWKIRSAQEGDLPFIYKTWINSYSGDSAVGKSVRKSIFHREYKSIVDRLLLASGTLVAHKPDDPVVIYGYLVFEPSILHYCFVKEAFRFSGIARALVHRAIGPQDWSMTYTHHTKHLNPIVEKYPLLTYNPFILYKELEEE